MPDYLDTPMRAFSIYVWAAVDAAVTVRAKDIEEARSRAIAELSLAARGPYRVLASAIAAGAQPTVVLYGNELWDAARFVPGPSYGS